MTGNLLTLADVRTQVRRFVDDGSCDNTTIDARLAEAEQRLWAKAELRLSTWRCRIHVQNQCFPLPIEVEKILHVDIDSLPSRIFNNAYEFLSSGPGDLDYITSGSGYRNLVDQGEFPTQFDIPVILTLDGTESSCCEGTYGTGYSLVAFSPEADDGLLELTIRGVDYKNDEIYSDQSGERLPGVVMKINQWSGGIEGNIVGQWTNLNVTTQAFKQITRVYKPATKGPVCLYAVDTTTNKMWLLSKMTPETTVPSYRRYRITNMACPQPGAASTDPLTKDCASILAIVKKRYMRPTRSTDVVAVQNVSAVRCMLIAMKWEQADDLTKSQAYEAQAVRLLHEEKLQLEQASGLPVVIDVERELSGGSVSRGYLI